MGGGRPGEMVHNDPPGSWAAMSEYDKLQFTIQDRVWREERRTRERQGKLQEVAVLLGKEVARREMIENQGENDD